MEYRSTSRRLLLAAYAVAFVIALDACSAPLPWPRSPLHEFPAGDPSWKGPTSVQEAMEAIAGRYAHYDVVAYEDTSTRTPMRTFTVSYGFTEFRLEGGRLYQVDSFCHAEQKLNQKTVKVQFSDEATRAIAPRVQEVQVRFENGRWVVVRPPHPPFWASPAIRRSRFPVIPGIPAWSMPTGTASRVSLSG